MQIKIKLHTQSADLQPQQRQILLKRNTYLPWIASNCFPKILYANETFLYFTASHQ